MIRVDAMKKEGMVPKKQGNEGGALVFEEGSGWGMSLAGWTIISEERDEPKEKEVEWEEDIQIKNHSSMRTHQERTRKMKSNATVHWTPTVAGNFTVDRGGICHSHLFLPPI